MNLSTEGKSLWNILGLFWKGLRRITLRPRSLVLVSGNDSELKNISGRKARKVKQTHWGKLWGSSRQVASQTTTSG
jgi:hypothetical protein